MTNLPFGAPCRVKTSIDEQFIRIFPTQGTAASAAPPASETTHECACNMLSTMYYILRLDSVVRSIILRYVHYISLYTMIKLWISLYLVHHILYCTNPTLHYTEHLPYCCHVTRYDSTPPNLTPYHVTYHAVSEHVTPHHTSQDTATISCHTMLHCIIPYHISLASANDLQSHVSQYCCVIYVYTIDYASHENVSIIITLSSSS